MGKTTIQVGDNWRIVRADALNWQIYQRREIGHSHRGTDRAGTVDWVPLQRFYSRPELAARYILDHSTDGADVVSLNEFMQLIDTTGKKLARSIAKVDA